MKLGLWTLVKGIEKKPAVSDQTSPTTEESAAVLAWEVRALKAAGELFLAIEAEQRTHIVGLEDDPVGIWAKLESVHLQCQIWLKWENISIPEDSDV